MNPDQLFVSSKNNAPSSRFSTIPTRVHHLYSSSKTAPQFVNSNGALNLSSLTDTNLEDEFGPSFSNIGLEVRTLRKALNLPKDSLPKTTGLTSNHWSHDHASRTSQVFLTDSGYSSKTNPQSVEAMQSISASRNEDVALHSGASHSVAFGLESSYDEQTNPLGIELNSWKHCQNSSKLYERSLKSSLDESETKRTLLLEKLREAHLTIQNQAEKLAATESDMCFLRGQLKSMAIEQEGIQQEVDCLTMEKKKLEFFKSESLKNHEAFLIRVNDLDKELKVLTATHNTLQIEATKKGAALEKTSFYVTSLQQDIDELQKVNNVLERELSSLRDIQDQHNKSNVSKKLEQLNKDYQKILQEHAVIKHQLSESVKASDKAKLKQDQMGQEIIQLRMERDIQCGKVSVLEEEILHQQQNYKSLVKEQERLLKEKAEQDQRLQREIRDRLCLKMVNDLLREESANVKEAFQKLEEFTNSVEQRSKDMSLELDQCKQENLTGNAEEMGNEKSWNGGLLLKIASAKSHCEDLESQVSFLQETNRTLNKEKEEREKQVQLIKMREENLTKQQVSKSRELKTENEKLKLSFTMISKKNEELQKQLEHQKEQMELLKSKSKELSASVPGSHQNDSIHFLQEEVDKIKETVTRLECEKTELITELNKLHKEKETWALQKSELEMTQAELSAENSQLRSELNKVAVKSTENQSIANVKKKLELEKEEAVKKVKEEMQGSFDEVCLELKNVKSELSKVWDMLESKEKQVEEQSQELQCEQEQSQKWAEELMQLRIDYADLTASTSSRTQMISTLRDELTQRCQEIIELEAALSFNQQKCNSVKTSPLKINGHGLKRRRSDGDISISYSHRCNTADNPHKECSEFKKLTAKNTYLNRRVHELITERNSALQDSQDLLSGMQQLREAFEEEIERELERERSKFEKEKQLLQMQSEESQQLPGVKSKLEMEVSHLTAQKVALEVKSKHLECERDELRNQVEELCRMRTAAEEKAVQVDSALSPRKRENKTSSRKRSKSVGMMSPSIQEIPSSFSQQ